MAFEDRPASWDSWNIDMYYEEHAYDVDGDTTVSPVTGGALYESVTVVKRFGRSVFTQEIRAWHAEPRVDFITHVDWREDATVLKTAFPLAINTDFATLISSVARCAARRTATPPGMRRNTRSVHSVGPTCPKATAAYHCSTTASMAMTHRGACCA